MKLFYLYSRHKVKSGTSKFNFRLVQVKCLWVNRWQSFPSDILRGSILDRTDCPLGVLAFDRAFYLRRAFLRPVLDKNKLPDATAFRSIGRLCVLVGYCIPRRAVVCNLHIFCGFGLSQWDLDPKSHVDIYPVLWMVECNNN
jgi:hypothetical protein